MKNLLLSICFAFTANLSFSQSIGLRGGVELSDNKFPNKAGGIGLYVNVNHFSKKLEAVMYTDLFSKGMNERKLGREDISYEKKTIGGAALFIIPNSNKLKFKFGPDISYNWIDATQIGKSGTYFTDGIKANYVGFGVMTNLQYRPILNFPITLDLFITPSYMVNAESTEHVIAHRSLKIVDIQLGLAYQFRKE